MKVDEFKIYFFLVMLVLIVGNVYFKDFIDTPIGKGMILLMVILFISLGILRIVNKVNNKYKFFIYFIMSCINIIAINVIGIFVKMDLQYFQVYAIFQKVLTVLFLICTFASIIAFIMDMLQKNNHYNKDIRGEYNEETK
ncbi:hypothetical protein [Anaerofustis butyriciformans]|uniref:hypothetical protein n=1 Tax=Anaerofustis butyriciformans TaxID=3108533 RepID=UPI002E32A383|nr:hypothetical protein [Anaerofustis sp. HA2171]